MLARAALAGVSQAQKRDWARWELQRQGQCAAREVVGNGESVASI